MQTPRPHPSTQAREAGFGVRRRDLVRLGGILSATLVTGAVTACGTSGPRRPGSRVCDLPRPRTTGGLSLAESLALRRSVRAFTSQPLTREEIGQLLWAAQGVTHGPGYRTAPSGGALYPLELYTSTRSTRMHYLPDGHRVEEWEPREEWTAVVDATPSVEPVRQAAAVFVLAAVVRRTARKYGGRSHLYVQLEAGHAAQNLLLQATALGLGAVTIGAFNEDRLARFFAMPAGHTPLYLVPVGRMAE